MSQPLVSIILPVYNSTAFLEQAVNSVFNQTCQEWELIIMDDGSGGGIGDELKKYAARDSRIRYYRQNNQGGGRARNNAVALADGKYIAFIDDDDAWLDDNKLEKQTGFLAAHEDYSVVGAITTRIVDEDGNFIVDHIKADSDDLIRKAMMRRNCFTTSAVMISKADFVKVGGFKNMRLAEDYDLWLRLGLLGRFANLDTTVQYMLRQSSTGAKRRLEMARITSKIIDNYKKNYPGYWRGKIYCWLRILYYWIFGYRPPYFFARKVFRKSQDK